MKYIRLNIYNLEPLCVSDDSTSQSGQTNCFKYIPGTTIRGFVINSLSHNEEFFTKYKKILFSNEICFLNAYPSDEGKELIPSLKGFYEDKKAEGPVKNVVIDGKFDEGMKRAGLGNYCRFDKNDQYGKFIRFYRVETGSVMKINIGRDGGGQKVFRGEQIAAGYSFTGYIAFRETVTPDLIDEIRKSFSCETVTFGNMRSQGFGKCRVKTDDADAPEVFNELPGKDNEEHIYMALLSNTVMRGRNGEYCGLDLQKLEEKMGVSDLKIRHCSTSLVTVHGYNRTLGIKLPTVPAYEQGSVFHFEYSGRFLKEKMMQICHEGVGERRNDGFGRVLFFDEDYDKVRRKEKGDLRKDNFNEETALLSEDDKKTLKNIAVSYYMKLLENAKQKRIFDVCKNRSFTKSQAGTVLSILENNRFSGSEVLNILNKYFDHALEKERNQKIQKERSGIGKFAQTIIDILKAKSYGELVGVTDEEIMGIKTSELLSEENSRRLITEYAIDLIKFAGKEN